MIVFQFFCNQSSYSFFSPFHSGALRCVPLTVVTEGAEFDPRDPLFQSALHDLTMSGFRAEDSFELMQAQDAEATITNYVRAPEARERLKRLDGKHTSIYPKYALDKAEQWKGDPKYELHEAYLNKKMETGTPFVTFVIDPRLDDPVTVS